MYIKNITIKEFENFVNKHPLGNYCQTSNYANLMNKNNYEYEFIGLIDEENKIHAASLILIKKIAKWFKFGYAPKGFIINYENKKLVKEFTNAIKTYYKHKKLVFIKINPEIAIAEINPKTHKKEYNCNIEIKNDLIDLGYTKLKDNLYFESKMPKYNGIIHLKKYNRNNLNKNTRNKIKRSETKGLKIEIADRSKIDIFFDFVKKKKKKNTFYYKDYYNAFSKTNNIDLFLVSIDTKDYLTNAKNLYEKELDINAETTQKLTEKKTEKKVNKKIESDKKLLSYKNDVLEAREKDQKNQKIYIAGALVVKYKNRINIVYSGYDTNYKRFNPNYFLHHQIFEHYKNNFDFADLNGMTGDWSKNNPYKGLNEFKMGFKPKIYEFIGEYDLILKPFIYRWFIKKGTLAKILNKTIKKK